MSEKALVKVPGDLGLPLEYLAIAKEMCLAYALLETHARLLVSTSQTLAGPLPLAVAARVVVSTFSSCTSMLYAAEATRQQGQPASHADAVLHLVALKPWQPGDCLILNAANSTVGQTIVQLCKLLKLRVVAVVRDASPRMVDFLKAIGATEVLKDEGSLKVLQLPLRTQLL